MQRGKFNRSKLLKGKETGSAVKGQLTIIQLT